ncbi:MmpS family transport accessory protein [Dactylosporangium sp. CA-139066]|uniref:MmpS family transport accessory protein n=1 Tax=Dactylosporangium sp. CA-139066 TaxID=3239930 RepID=UPI003D900518
MRKNSLIALSALSLLALGCGVDTNRGTTQGPGFTASTAPDHSGTAAAQPAKNGTHAVVFEVTGKGVTKATSVTYGIGGNSSQANGAALPWKKEASSTDMLLTASIVAQSGNGTGTITCRITVDGKVVVENSSEGQYAVVTCSGNA